MESNALRSNVIQEQSRKAFSVLRHGREFIINLICFCKNQELRLKDYKFIQFINPLYYTLYYF